MPGLATNEFTTSRILLILIVLFLITPLAHGAVWDANFTKACEVERQHQIEANPLLRQDRTFVCGQTYDRFTAPAQEISIPLAQCLIQTPGWEKSRIDKASQWAGPLVGFLLPALGFVIVIPREWTVEIAALRASFRKGNTWRQWFRLVPMFGALVLDTLLGILVVFGWAGPFIAGALHEVLVDHFILDRVQRWTCENKTGPARDQEWFAVAIVLVGSFAPNKVLCSAPASPSATQPLLHIASMSSSSSSPQKEYQSFLVQPYPEHRRRTFADMIQSELHDPENAAVFLNRICIQFVPFSGLVGVSLVFYAGSFIYSLVDARTRLGENDTAHAVAFGLWYFVIVLAAIISSTVLGVTLPTNIESALAHRRINSSDYKHKWLSERRSTLAQWAAQPSPIDPTVRTLTGDTYHRIFHRHSLALSASLLAALTIAVPCALAITVSYNTPQIGLSCRSASILAYLVSQFVLIALWFFHSSPSIHHKRKTPTITNTPEKLLIRLISTMYVTTGILSVFFALAGTMMQLLGVYRSCICKVGLWYALPTTGREAWGEARVLLSTDTALARSSARLWIKCGEAGIVWVAGVCVVGAAHRVLIKARCMEVVENFRGR